MVAVALVPAALVDDLRIDLVGALELLDESATASGTPKYVAVARENAHFASISSKVFFFAPLLTDCRCRFRRDASPPAISFR